MKRLGHRKAIVLIVLVVGVLFGLARMRVLHPARSVKAAPADGGRTAPAFSRPDNDGTGFPKPSRNEIRLYVSPGRAKGRYGGDLVSAVSNAAPGDTIAVGPGTYEWSATLYPRANVNIVGSGEDETVLVYRGSNIAVVVQSGFVMFQKLHLKADRARQLINCDGQPAFLLNCRIANPSGLALFAEGAEITAVSSEIVGGIDVSVSGILKTQKTRYDRDRAKGTVEERNLGPRTGCLVDNWTFAEGGRGRWRVGSCWAITNGCATWNCSAGGGDGYLTQETGMKPGRRYSLIWKVSGSSGSFLERSIRTGGQSLDFTRAGDGVFAKKFTASTAEPLHVYVEPAGDGPTATRLDFVHLQEIDDARPEGTLTADRAVLYDAAAEERRKAADEHR